MACIVQMFSPHKIIDDPSKETKNSSNFEQKNRNPTKGDGAYYVKIAHEIRCKTALQLKKEKKLQPIGYGGQMMGDIQKVCLSFQYWDLVDLEKARELTVYAAQTLMHNLNSSEEVRPYLHDYPCTAKNVEIRIWILMPDRNDPPIGDIEYIIVADGLVTYYIRQPGLNQLNPDRLLKKETFEESVNTINTSGMKDQVHQTD